MIRVEDQIEEHLDLCSTYRQQHDSVWATFAFQITPGVVSARASLLTNSVAVEYQTEKTDFAFMRKSIEQAGYKVAEDQTVAEIAASDEGLAPEEIAQQQEYRTLMRKFWFAAIVSVPVMALSYPDLIPRLREWMPMGSDTRRIVWALLGVVSLSVLLWSGSQFFTGTWDALKNRAANTHKLMVKGVYTPDTIVDRAGRPVGLNFRREETASCSDNVIFADFGKSADLPAGENVAVGFVPKGAGEYAIA